MVLSVHLNKENVLERHKQNIRIVSSFTEYDNLRTHEMWSSDFIRFTFADLPGAVGFSGSLDKPIRYSISESQGTTIEFDHYDYHTGKWDERVKCSQY